MAYTEDQLNAKIQALEAALDRQELEVEFADRRIRYRTFDEIKSGIDYYNTLLAQTSATARPKQFYGVASGKGF